MQGLKSGSYAHSCPGPMVVLMANSAHVVTQAQGLRARFHAGVFWKVVATLATQGSDFLANLVITNLLGRDGFGEFSIVRTTVLALAGSAQDERTRPERPSSDTHCEKDR